MGKAYLIDTCAVIKYLNNLLPEEATRQLDSIVDEASRISFITKIELLVWNPSDLSDMVVREEFISGSEICYINDDIITRSIEIRKRTNIKLPDAIIAATAMINDYELISTNDNDFKKILDMGLKYWNPLEAIS